MIYWGIRLPTALRSGPTRAAKRSPCRRCRQSPPQTTTARLQKQRASPYTPGWRARRMSARSWSLCRYITRPAVSTERLSLTAQGNVRYRLKTPYRDGTTDVVFEPLDLMAHFPVRHPSGDLRSSKSAVLPISHAPGWRHWCRRRASTSRAITGCSHRIIDYVSRSPRPDVADARQRPPMSPCPRATSR